VSGLAASNQLKEDQSKHPSKCDELEVTARLEEELQEVKEIMGYMMPQRTWGADQTKKEKGNEKFIKKM
jgi:hypothetical protein